MIKTIKATTLVPLVVVTALTLAGCGAGSAGNQSDTGATASGGKQSPSIETLEGEEFDLADKRGEVVALYFMAGWCGTCIPEAQAWSELYPKYKDEGLTLLMVSTDPNDSKQTIKDFRRAGNIRQLPWAIDETGEFTRSLDVRALDSTIIINRNGEIAYRDEAPTDKKTLESKVEGAL